MLNPVVRQIVDENSGKTRNLHESNIIFRKNITYVKRRLPFFLNKQL